MSNRLVIGVCGRIQLGMNGLQIKLSTNFTFTAENPYNLPLYSMPSHELNLVRQSSFSKNRQKQGTTPNKLHFSSVGKHAGKWLPAADRKHVNTLCVDTVKCRLDAGKSPIFLSQSPCTYIYVQESQRFWDFVRNITYCSRKGLKSAIAKPLQCAYRYGIIGISHA